MALEKQTVIDRTEIDEDGAIHVRRATYIVEDGVRIAGPSYHRIAYEPGADIAAEGARVKTVAAAIWTPDVVSAYRAKRDAERKIVNQVR